MDDEIHPLDRFYDWCFKWLIFTPVCIVLGLVETGVVAAGGSTYRDAVAFAVLILILLLRPEGLLGKRTREKV